MERISALTGTELGEAERQLAQAQAEAGGDGWEDVDEDEEAMEEDETDATTLRAIVWTRMMRNRVRPWRWAR